MVRHGPMNGLEKEHQLELALRLISRVKSASKEDRAIVRNGPIGRLFNEKKSSVAFSAKETDVPDSKKIRLQLLI